MNFLSHFPWENIYIPLNGTELASHAATVIYKTLLGNKIIAIATNLRICLNWSLRDELGEPGDTDIRVEHESLRVAFTSHSRFVVIYSYTFGK